MKRILLLIVTALILSSCSMPKYLHAGYRPVRDYTEQMTLLKENFPEIYDLYRSGEVVLDEMYEYEKNGSPQVHISYHYRNGGRR